MEPQKYLIPYLKKNYAFHSKSAIYNGAIGPIGDLKLYSIKKSVWKELDVNYAKNWPEYRAPTGVTSTSKENVRQWLEKHLKRKSKVEIDNQIIENTVQSIDLSNLLSKMEYEQSIDILQIDAEGYDDEIIYHSNIDKLKPKIINFEANLLSLSKLYNLKIYLENQGYILTYQGYDALAILSDTRN